MDNNLQTQLLRISSKSKMFANLAFLMAEEEPVKLLPLDLEEKDLDSTEEIEFTTTQEDTSFLFLGEVLEDTRKESCFYLLMFSFEYNKMCWVPLEENNKLEKRIYAEETCL
jgi:hypothetical protein